MLSQLIAYYNAYEEELEELYKNAPPLAGFLGMAGHPKDDRCNDIFYGNVENGWRNSWQESLHRRMLK